MAKEMIMDQGPLELGDDLEIVRDNLRHLLEKIAPPEQVRKWDCDDSISRDSLSEIAKMGLCGFAVPEKYGGAGRNVRGLVMVVEELSRRSVALASLYIQCASYAGLNISELGSEEQKKTLLPQIADGNIIFALGLSEPDIGADLASVRTRARIEGDTIVVDGAKRWCTGAEMSDYIYALVRTGPVENRYRNLSFLLIPTTVSGVSISRVQTMGLRGAPTNEVSFDNVRIPIANIVGGEAAWNKGWSQLAGPTLEIEKLQPAAIGLGIGEGAVSEAWEYSQQRRQFGKRICGHQAVRHQLADVQTKLQACRLMVRYAVDLIDGNHPSATHTSMTKLFVSQAIREITIGCQEVLGAYGYAEGFNMERYVRDALVLPIFGGSSAIQRNNIANLLGLPKD
jgi:alkylation response protein AidB-like acyl-CoA dehydrogenase